MTATLSTPQNAPDRVRRAAWSVGAVFFINGLGYATWASRIPAIKESLALDPARLGLLLMCVSAGSLIGLPTAGHLAARIGARRTVVGSVVVYCVGLAGLGVGADLAPSIPLAAAGLFLVGLGNGTWDVAMNLEGALVEQGLGRAIMPWFHAAFSGGTVAMALAAAGIAYAGLPVWVHFLVVAALWPLLGWLSVRGFLPAGDESEGDEPAPPAASAWLEPRTLLIGVVVLIAALTEGTANDWMSLAFVEGHHLPEWLGILGFATFLTAMTVGRVLGTSALDRFGRVPVLRTLFVLAAVGAGLVVFGGPVGAFAGAAIWGVGASLGFPVGMSAASDDPRRAAARVSVVSTIGYTAFLGGPPLLGFLGAHVGVLQSLLLIGALAVVALLLVPVTRKQES